MDGANPQARELGDGWGEPLPDSAPRRGRSRGHMVLLALAVLAPMGLAVLGTLVRPDERGYGTHEQLGLPACSLVDWFGIPCPGCGVTTSVALAARGRIAEAFLNQPFGLLVALLAAAFLPWALWSELRGRDLWRDLQRLPARPWLASLAGLLAASWIYKIARVFTGS